MKERYYQTTTINPISCMGIGIHTGQKVCMTICPAPSDTGIVFVRDDILHGDQCIKSSHHNVVSTYCATTLGNSSGVTVSTVEHLLASLYACGIDNAYIHLDGPEVPIMDGSSVDFILMLQYAQKQNLSEKKLFAYIKKEICVNEGGASIIAEPSSALQVSSYIDFAGFEVESSSAQYHSQKDDFISDFASARTFGFVQDMPWLQSKGLCLGASYDNAIAIDRTIGVLSDLRMKDELARHKVLDTIGDINTSEIAIVAKFTGSKNGHYLNNILIRKIFDDPNNFEVTYYQGY